MGLYDFVEYKCAYCGRMSEAQTKLWRCSFHRFKVGNKFDLFDCILLLKEACDCGKKSAIVIKNKKMVGVVEASKATHIEWVFGEIYTIEKESGFGT